MAYTLTWEPKGIHARFSGVCSVTELMETFMQISRAPVSVEVSYVILDYVDVESQCFTEMDALNVVAFEIGLSRLMPKLRFAVLVRDGRALDAWRTFVSHHPFPERYQVFRSPSELGSWLGGICLPSPQAPSPIVCQDNLISPVARPDHRQGAHQSTAACDSHC